MNAPPLSRAKGTRAALIAAALVHPGFAHVPDASLRASLCSYLRRCEGEDEFPIDWGDRTMRAFALSHVAERFGVVCALCGGLRRKPGARIDVAFCHWVVGAYEDACLPAFRTHPVCTPCGLRVPIHGERGRAPEDTFADWLCYLFANWFFRERVARNADVFASLRFDPRAIRETPPPTDAARSAAHPKEGDRS